MTEMMDVHLERTQLVGVELHTPDTGWVKADVELVTRLQAGDAACVIECDWEEDYGTKALGVQTERMSVRMAQRLLGFCGATFDVDNYDFDCHGLVGYVSGWQETFAARSAYFQTFGQPMSLATDIARPNRAYVVHDPHARNQNKHSFFGTERPGYAFSVLGPGLPPIVNPLSEFQRIFGAAQFCAIRPDSY